MDVPARGPMAQCRRLKGNRYRGRSRHRGPEHAIRGTHRGTVAVKSNGGDATVVVTVEVGNHAPAIAQIKAEPENLAPGGRGAVVVTASDVDGDKLGYTWTATGGTITGSGHLVTWTAPTAEGYYTVSCTVSDGHGGVAQAQVTIGVASSIATSR